MTTSRGRNVGIAVFAATLGLSAATVSFAQLDFGDHSSATLTSKAWDAYGSQRFDDALAYIDKCIELYEGEAKTMQASLTDFPPTDPPEATSKYWALNDVGTCLFIKGEIFLKQGNPIGAKAAFDQLVNELGYAQCWDPKGWYWKPAEAAKQKLVELEFDSQ